MVTDSGEEEQFDHAMQHVFWGFLVRGYKYIS